MEAYKILSIDELSILKLSVENDMLVATISDGRIVSIPIVWFSRLRNASKNQLNNFEISPSGYGIHWPDLDEDISIKSFLS
jgi:hypothetical protein